MSVFHSGTDNGDLKQQLMKNHYNYYVSLIVNNKNEFDLSVAYKAITSVPKTIFTHKGLDGKEVSYEIDTNNTTEAIYYYKGNVTTVEIVDNIMLDCYTKLNSKPVPPPRGFVTQYPRIKKDAWDFPSLFDSATPTTVKVTKEDALSFLGNLLPSYKYTVGKMLEDMESKIAEDEGSDVYNGLFDSFGFNIDKYTDIDIDSPKGQALVRESITYLSGLNLVYPDATALAVDILTSCLIEEEEDEIWKQPLKQ